MWVSGLWYLVREGFPLEHSTNSREGNLRKGPYFVRKSVKWTLNAQSTCKCSIFLTILAIDMPNYRQVFSGSKIGGLPTRLQAQLLFNILMFLYRVPFPIIVFTWQS